MGTDTRDRGLAYTFAKEVSCPGPIRTQYTQVGGDAEHGRLPAIGRNVRTIRDSRTLAAGVLCTGWGMSTETALLWCRGVDRVRELEREARPSSYLIFGRKGRPGDLGHGVGTLLILQLW